LGSKLFSKLIHDLLIPGKERFISAPGFVTDWLNNARVYFTVTGDELPESLATQLKITALVFAFGVLPAVAASVDAYDSQRVNALPVYLGRLPEIVLHVPNLRTVSPIGTGLNGDEITDSAQIKLKIDPFGA
jgi:hypothetical protein